MRDIADFKQLRSASGELYFVGQLAGVMVGLLPTGRRDEHGNPVWRLIAKTPKTTLKGRAAELLTGGCVLVRIDQLGSQSKPRPPRRISVARQQQARGHKNDN